ncbi:MAG: hypothetical protein Q4B28_03515 [bacterium]|nr:hypothetical protein [bacterium]
MQVDGNAPSYTLSFANQVPQKALWKVGITNHMKSIGMSAQLELNPSQEALDEEERNRRKQQDTAGNGRNLQFDLAGAYLDKSFSAVHFNVGGDDFGGGIFWQRSEDLTEPVILDYNGTNLACLTQLKGFYYNSQRGERLWPLDQTSLEKLQATYQNKYANWKIKGGWYTDCYPQGQQNDLDQYKTAIYGVIQHLEGNDLRYTLLAGASYDPRNEKMTPNAKCNLQMLNNAYPFGYLYDTAGGIATLGVRINSEQIKTNYLTVNQFHTNFLHELNNGACVNQYFDHDGDELSAKSNIGNFTPPP